MLTAKVRIQVLVFVVLALAVSAFVGAKYAGLGRLLGSGSYLVKIELADGGGLFTNGEVTYRGVAVGRVGELRLTRTGMEADLLIDDSAPRIPVNSMAIVTNRSAVGEQYVDLQPRTDGGPFLGDGAVIPRESTRIPLPVQDLLGNLSALSASVPTESLRTVIDEFDDALRNSGPNLQVLIDSANSFTQSAAAHLPQTQTLIGDGATVLRTQVDSTAAWRTFTGSAKQFAAALSSSDGDLRKLIETAPQASTQVTSLLRENSPGLPVLVANLLTLSKVFSSRSNGLEQLLVNTPRAVATTSSAITPDTAHLSLALTFNDPPPCLKGYESTTVRSSDVVTPLPLNTTAACTLPYGDPSSVRGSQNAPHPPVPDAAKPGGVGPVTLPGLQVSTDLKELLWLGK
ncbi:phospholipid/cholesterol/gamma-HCH transport system substrate-binding protein [Amycolatopsis xylanica]|uniref:Phospholipid/cholesterol/gamma-HCH transport system substrate-binding protein n=1 Tax=Amycolatopsis xylanica TaxID=589385 RepID=A0A1H3CH78_9PSEU|nr:MlaD family protein [Amycolatopsis xylanica]SDX53572.1 phospholipid/cholesterol/gamma-HCH transport system substrate-binding protein [Amycolatopsis xylanica]